MTTVRIDTKTKPARELVNFLRSLSHVKVMEDKAVVRDFSTETVEAIKQTESGESVACENYDVFLSKIVNQQDF
jgi:hypothetical protein